jgi:hypothetical protein
MYADELREILEQKCSGDCDCCIYKDECYDE